MIAWGRSGIARQPEKSTLAVSPYVGDSTGRKKRKQKAKKRKSRHRVGEAIAEL